MARLRSGEPLQIGDVMDEFACSKTTAKRDLTGLRQSGQIVFKGSPRTGAWHAPPLVVDSVR